MENPPVQLQQALVNAKIISQDAIWHVQVGGRTNRVWRVTDQRDLICKLFSSEKASPLFPNDPKVEWDCLTQFADEDLCPKPVALVETPVGDCLVYHFIDGPVWDGEVHAVAKIMQQVWKLPAVPILRILSQSPKDILNEADEILGLMKTLPEALMAARPTLSPIKTIEPVVVHTDIVPQNLIHSAKGLRLIDWQCPALGDPVVDVATFLSPAMQNVYRGRPLTKQQNDAFLADLPLEVSERYKAVGKFYHWRLACYAAWRAGQGVTAYSPAWQAELALLQSL